MKKIILLFSILYWNAAYAQSDCKQSDYVPYLAAYNYIINDSINKGKDINIYNSTDRLNVAIFQKELKYPGEDEESLFIRFHNIYQNTDSISNLASLTMNKRECRNIVFFSPIIGDSILCAELFYNENYYTTYNRIAFQNQSHLYLFILNATGTIKTVFKKEMIYD